jgi:tetratricopeptide (TPR) repeat protein
VVNEKKPPDAKRFSIALSFPGEYRTFVEKVADNLAATVTKEYVLYDKYWEAEFARPDLDTYLPNLYRSESELVVIFLCPEYNEKRWCNLEWRFIKQLIATPEKDKIMLLSFGEPGDLADIGILPRDGYINITSRQPREIANLILQRHGLHAPQTITCAPLSQQKEPTTEVKREDHFHGKQRGELLNFFVSDWLPNGPAVAMLQGFPGCGKTQLASSVAAQAPRTLDPVEPQLESDDPSLDLLTDLALALDYEGIHDLMQELEKGADGDLYDALLRVLRRERILVIIDEFQRILSDKDRLPPKSWQNLVERLNNSPRPAGRLLLISNRSIKTVRWCEKSASRELKGLTDSEAADFLQAYLAAKDLSEKVPTERFIEIGHRLGGNPRALKTLVESLKYYPLDELISLAPDLFKPGDVTLNPDLVEDFERELIERTLSSMDGDLLQFMRRLAVYRRPFRKEAYAEYAAASFSSQALRKQLIDRYLLENTASGDTLHPLAREISVTRLRDEKEEWRQAHSLAADCYFSFFKSFQMKEARKLTSSYAELRHHLYEAGRINELSLASDSLTNFALSQIPAPAQSKIPDNLEIMEEHIALISALPEKQRPKGLEYHLALCLKHRNTGDDYQQALFHVRRATGPHAYYAVWLLQAELEYALSGVEAMYEALNDAIRHLGSGSNAFAVYHRCAHILRNDDKLDEAIRLLKRAIVVPGIACVTSLISLCARCLEEAGRYDDAINILKEGVTIPNVQELGTVYIHCAGLLARQNRVDEALTFLKDGINLPGMTKIYSVYLMIAEYLAKEGHDEEAIRLLKQGVKDTRVLDARMMYRYCAELLVKKNRIDAAATMLRVGIASKQVKDPLPLYHYFAELMEKVDNREEGVKFLKSAMTNPRTKAEPSIYLACAKLLFHRRNLDAAIEVLQQGLQVPRMKEQNHLVQMCAEVMAKQGRLDDAIEILEKRISGSDAHHLDFLYKDCSTLMEKAGRLEDAIALMKKGLNAPGMTNKAVMYQACAKLLAKAGRAAEGVDLLKKALGQPGLPGRVMLYQTCAWLMSNVGLYQDAIKLLNKAINGPKLGNIISLYSLSAELMVADGQREEAISMLNKVLAEYPGDKNLETALEKAIGQAAESD